MSEENAAFSSAQMLIRRPVKEVFQAFIDPALTTHFWFTKGSGKLEVGKKIIWEWEMYQISVSAIAKEIVPGEKIVLEWGTPAKTVAFKFDSLSESSTYVTIIETGYRQEGDALLAVIRDSTGGFTTVLDGLKAFLEHGIHLNLIADKFPQAITTHGQ